MPRSVRDSMRKRWAQRLRERREALRHRLRQGCSARDIATAAAREWSHGWMSGGTANPLGASSGCAPGGGMDEEVAGDGPAPRCSGATGLDAGREWRDKQNLFNDDVDDLIGYMEHLIESGLLDEGGASRHALHAAPAPCHALYLRAGLPAQLEQVINEDAAEVDALAEEFDSLGSGSRCAVPSLFPPPRQRRPDPSLCSHCRRCALPGVPAPRSRPARTRRCGVHHLPVRCARRPCSACPCSLRRPRPLFTALVPWR